MGTWGSGTASQPSENQPSESQPSETLEFAGFLQTFLKESTCHLPCFDFCTLANLCLHSYRLSKPFTWRRSERVKRRRSERIKTTALRACTSPPCGSRRASCWARGRRRPTRRGLGRKWKEDLDTTKVGHLKICSHRIHVWYTLMLQSLLQSWFWSGVLGT